MGKLQDLAKEKLRRWDYHSTQEPDNVARNIVSKIGTDTGLTDTLTGFAEGDPDVLLAGLRRLAGGPKNTSWPLEEDPIRDKFVATNTSYSGSDCVPIIQINGSLITLGSVQTISISTFREKEPVRVLGKSYVKGYTAGPRTIAGSITFTLFNRDPFWEILKYLKEENKTTTDRYHTPIGDQIPPVNLILWFSNEYGRKSLQTIYGIEFNQEGQVHSINDVYSEKTVNYVARDMDILVDYDDVEGFRNLMYERQLTGQFTDTYLESLLAYKSQVQRQLQDVEIIINQIATERSKRAARGIITLSVSLWGKNNNDLKDELDKQIKRKKFLVAELINTDAAITAWTKTAYNSSTYFGSDGGAIHDAIRQQAPTTSGPESPAELATKRTNEIEESRNRTRSPEEITREHEQNLLIQEQLGYSTFAATVLSK